MFGEYAQVASYIQPAQNEEIYQKRLPAYLRPNFHLPHPWNQGRETSGLNEDFIMIAEFSELEGPKPLMTIPKDGGADFDQNTFAVRILAVDHQNPTDGFTISEDVQVILCDSEAGVFAFVHHLVLYDNSARGFVRPYCIAFITADQKKLLYFYEELSMKFKKVARFLKYGNKMVFAGDLERHLRDLEYTKNVLLTEVSKIRLRNPERTQDEMQDIRKNAENELYRGLQTIQQSSLEIKDILSVLKPLLPDRRLEARFRLLEDRAHQGQSSAGLDKLSLPDSCEFNDFTAKDIVDTRYGSLSEPRISPLALFKPREYKPVLVETKKAKRFNLPLRGLHELCSWGAREGLKKLRHIHMYFKRDMTVLELEKHESRLLRPHCTNINHGQCITGNFLSGVQMKTSVNAKEEAEQGWSMLYSHHWGSLGSLDSQDSFKSADSSPCLNGLTEASPSSFHTYDSQSGHGFLSASASPDREISLLMSDEYYPDMTTNQDEEITYLASNASHDIHLKDKVSMTGVMNNVIMSSDDTYSQKQLRSSSGSGYHISERTQIGDTEIISLSQEGSQILPKERDINQKCTTPDSAQRSSFYLNLDMKDQETYYNSFSNNENTQRNEKCKFVSKNDVLKIYGDCHNMDDVAYKTQIFNTLGESNILKVQHEKAEMILQNRKEMSIFQDGNVHIITNSNQDGFCQGRALTVQSFISASENNYSNEENSGQILADNTTQSLSENPKCCPGVISTVDGHDGTQNEENEELPLRKINPDPEGSRSCSNNSPELLKEHVQPNEIKRCDSMLSILLELEQNQRNENKVSRLPLSTKKVPGILQKDSEIPQTSLRPFQISVNGCPSTQGSVDKLQVEMNNQMASDGSINIASKLSQSHLPINLPHHITRIIHTQSEKSNSSGIGNEDELTRVRTESDVSSAFTEISMQDLYPRLIGVDKEPKVSALCNECEAADVNDECTGIPTSHNTVSWKPRCSMYTVGDWINNLTQGRPGFGLSEVLSTYQYLEHVIFSLLSGRPVLVAGSAKLESEVIKIVSALTVFLPVTKRNSHAVLEWTLKPLKITDLIKLKLIGVCRPDRRSLESFIPGAIKKACTVVDIEKRIIVAPPYQGQFITTLSSKRKGLKSDVQLLTYIEWWLMDILAKAFIYFHSFCLGPAGSVLYSHSPRDQRDAHQLTVSSIMAKLGVKECDCEIVEHLTELVKLSKLEPHIWQGIDSGSTVTPLTLQHKVCEKFCC